MAVPWIPSKRSVASWVVYDLASTIFALGVGALYFAAWFTDNSGEDLALGVTNAIAMAAVILLAPWFGALSDHSGRKAVYLIPTTLLAVGSMFFLGSAGVAGSLVMYAVALVGFNLGGVVYDALLPDVSTSSNRGFISGLRVGIGYVGSFIAVLVGVVMLDRYGYPAVFRTLAVLFLLFALPAFFFIEERPRIRSSERVGGITTGLRRLIDAWRLAATYEGVVPFLVGRFLYTDAINTLIGGFLTIFVIKELGFTDGEVQALLGVAVVTSIIGGLGGGWVTDKVGPRRALHGALYLWMGTMTVGIVVAVADLPEAAFAVGAAGGLALGATWASDRVYMARISPPRHLGEFYGLYATVGRFATVLGPLVWGVIVTVLGLPRIVAMGALIGFLVVGRLVLSGVDDASRHWGPVDVIDYSTGPDSTGPDSTGGGEASPATGP